MTIVKMMFQLLSIQTFYSFILLNFNHLDVFMISIELSIFGGFIFHI